MTRDDAVAVAKAEAHASGQPVDIWQHTGDRKVLPTGRFIARPAAADPPHFHRWTKVDTVIPEDAAHD